MIKPVLIVFAALLLTVSMTYAQPYGYTNAAQSGILRTSSRTFFMNNLMNNNIIYLNKKSTANKLYFEVALKNSGRNLSFMSKIFMDSIKHKTYIEYTDISLRDNDPKRFQKIYPSDLKKISIWSDNVYTFEPQLTTDSCWMFRMIKGEITVYTNYLAPVALQKHEDAIQQFNKDALFAIIKDDKQAMELYDKREYIRAIEKYNRNFKKAEDKAYDEAHRVD